jgi:hypothetical protein
MKKYSFLLLVGAILLMFARCSKDDEKEYYTVMGTLHVTNDSVILIDDADTRYWINDPSSGFISSVHNNDRMIVYFSFSKKPAPAGVDYVIDLYDAYRVLNKPLVILTESNADSIGNDPINVRSVWAAKDYLNFNFEYYGSSQTTHYINLIRNPGDITGADTINVELRHNKNNDDYSYLMNGYVTFDISSLHGEPGDSVVLRVRSKEYSDHIFEKYVTYKF